MILVIYLVFMNIAAFILYGIDKKKAEDGKYRISEASLLFFSVLGGAFGALLGMKIFHHKTRKKKFSITVPIFAVLLCISIILCLWQNYHIVVTEYDYTKYEAGDGLDMRIVQISDLHNQFFGFKQSILLDKIKKCEPDMIVVTGDVVDSTHTVYALAEDFFEGAVKIAPVYYIKGNHEVSLEGKRLDVFIEKIKAVGVQYIDGGRAVTDKIEMIGTYDNSMNLVSGFESGDDRLKILLAHDPDYVRQYEKSGADLILAGHIHGGQIIIPGKGGLLSPNFKFFPEYYEGVHKAGDSIMIVSRGLGNSILPVRINDYPEIVVIKL